MRTAAVGLLAAAVVVIPLALVVWLLSDRPFVPPEALALAGLSGLVETAYFVLLAAAYRRGDLSVVYPTARGTAPLIAVIIGITLLGERLAPVGFLGVAALLAGILILQRPWYGLRPGADPRDPGRDAVRPRDRGDDRDVLGDRSRRRPADVAALLRRRDLGRPDDRDAGVGARRRAVAGRVDGRRRGRQGGPRRDPDADRLRADPRSPSRSLRSPRSHRSGSQRSSWPQAGGRSGSARRPIGATPRGGSRPRSSSWPGSCCSSSTEASRAGLPVAERVSRSFGTGGWLRSARDLRNSTITEQDPGLVRAIAPQGRRDASARAQSSASERDPRPTRSTRAAGRRHWGPANGQATHPVRTLFTDGGNLTVSRPREPATRPRPTTAGGDPPTLSQASARCLRSSSRRAADCRCGATPGGC